MEMFAQLNPVLFILPNEFQVKLVQVRNAFQVHWFMSESQKLHQNHINVELFQYQLEFFEKSHVLIFNLGDLPLDFADQIV
jgi:hypothetical protein